QIVDPAPMLGGNRKHLLDPKPMKLIHDRRLLFRVGFVDREEKRTSSLAQQTNQFKIWSRKRGASIHNHHNRRSFIERNPRLAENLGRNKIFFFRENPAGVDDAHPPAAPLRVSIKPVARDAGLVAHNSPPRSHDAVEQRGLAHVRPAHDRYGRNARCASRESAGRIVSGLGQSEGLMWAQPPPAVLGSQTQWFCFAEQRTSKA